MSLNIGAQLQLPTYTGEPLKVVVIDVPKEAVVLEASNLLARKDLTFKLELVEIV